MGSVDPRSQQQQQQQQWIWWQLHREEAAVPAELSLLQKEEQDGEGEVLCCQSQETYLGPTACGPAAATIAVVQVEVRLVWL